MARDWSPGQPEFGGVPPGDPAQHTGISRRTQAYLVLGGVVALSALLLIAQNSNKVELEWLWFDFKAALWLFFVLTLVAGMGLGQILMVLFRRSRQRRTRDARHPDEV